MPRLNWGMVTDGGTFESLMHAILFAEDPATVLFGRPGKDAGQDARSADGTDVYQAKYRQGLNMDGSIALALKELEKIKNYRQPSHAYHRHWQNAQRWVLVANFQINPNDEAKWRSQVEPVFQKEGLAAVYWHIDILEGKLAQHPEVSDCFFSGENRVLVSLKEAHDLLGAECIGSLSLDIPMVGREGELKLIESFASSGETRILPVIGPGGIGKSRLLYEGLVSLAQDGWRVLWALPGAMAKSTQWFRLLNGAQKTCVALDAPDDPNLLRLVIEQLATLERRNWRVIVAYRTEKAKALLRFRTNRLIHEPLRLTPLDETNAHALVNACLQGSAQPSWLHSVYSFTKGVPGWLCLIGELAKKGKLSSLPLSVDEVAALYVGSCIDELGAQNHEQGRALLRWLALWGTISVDDRDTENTELSFLVTQGIPQETTRDLLKRFVDAGIVRNWGVGRRLYAVEPLIVRHHIVSSWLYLESEQGYEVNDEGHRIISLIVKDQIPTANSVLKTLSKLARSRLGERDVYSFLRPVFESIADLVVEGNVVDQYRIADIIQNVGAADPESALDILRNIWRSPKGNMTVSTPHMGDHTITHGALVASLPWTLFQLAENVSTSEVARRYIEEFRHFVALEDAGNLRASSGKTPRALLKRILMGVNNAGVFAQPAHALVAAKLIDSASWPFVGLVAECLLNPIRETVELVAEWTVTITRRPMAPGSCEWILAAQIRGSIISALKSCQEDEIRRQLWEVLADSHHAFHHEVLRGNVKGSTDLIYRQVLIDDLTSCEAILGAPPVAMTIAEATHARKMWSWYLRYGKDSDLVGLARGCEKIYVGLSDWRLHEFFRFATEEELAPETARIAHLLLSATDSNIFIEFFDEATRYLDAARDAKDMADDWRLSSLADACADQFVIDASTPANPLTKFTLGVLDQSEPLYPLSWWFAVRVCQRHLLNVKSLDEFAVETSLSALLNATRAKSRLLRDLYSNVHPSTTGALTKVEFDFLLEYEADLSICDWFLLLGPFYTLDSGQVQERLRVRLKVPPEAPAELSQCMSNFILSTYLTALRYNWSAEQMPIGWIIDMITSFGLDGKLLGMHQLEWMRDKSSFRLSMVQLTALIRSRCELERNVRPYVSFEILPHSFTINDWVVFDASQEAEMRAFLDLCLLALGSTFTAIYWMPKYIRQIDPSGCHVTVFVRQYLDGTPDISGDALARLGYLASGYESDSSQWAAIAGLICDRSADLSRAERERVYFGLSRKETGVIMSMPGQVPDYYAQANETAIRLRNMEPSGSSLRDYREWAVRRAEEEIIRHQKWMEESHDD